MKIPRIYNKLIRPTREISDSEVTKFNEDSLEIIYLAQCYWGAFKLPSDNMTINLAKLSELSKEKLGFGVKIKSCWGPMDRNSYATYIKSGQNCDLVFPNRFFSIEARNESYDFWGDQYINEGLYMDISPYLAQFCPEAIVNFDRYPEINEICTKAGGTYAIYAGMPDIKVMSLFVKNKILEENKIESINDFDTLYEVMQNMYQGNNDIADSNKILLSYGTDLLNYIIYKSGYYPLYEDYMTRSLDNIVIRQDDEKCKPYLIEDTDLFDKFYEEFYRFFEKSYFLADTRAWRLEDIKFQDFFITKDPLFQIKYFSQHITDDRENIFKYYSVFLFENEKQVVSSPESILFAMVPYTCKQPEKSLHFMQWLMTDEDAADVLTFGTQMLNIKHYRYSEDGTIIPEKINTMYGFCNLVSNLSNKAFLCGNKEFDISKTYREMTTQAFIPPLYKKLISQHKNYDSIQNLYVENEAKFFNRSSYLIDTINNLINNSESTLTPDDIKKGLYELTDADKLQESCNEAIRNILESGEEIFHTPGL